MEEKEPDIIDVAEDEDILEPEEDDDEESSVPEDPELAPA